jgi:hypothetical protein
MTALKVRKKDKEIGMNSTLFVFITSLCKIQSSIRKKNICQNWNLSCVLKLLTTMKRGATNTHRENIMQIHPRTWTRFWPCVRNRVSTHMRPNPKLLNRRRSLKVRICTKLINFSIYYYANNVRRVLRNKRSGESRYTTLSFLVA